MKTETKCRVAACAAGFALPRYADQVVLIDHGVLIQGDPQTVLDSEEFHRTFHMRGGRA